jgi:hypothetical protein
MKSDVLNMDHMLKPYLISCGEAFIQELETILMKAKRFRMSIELWIA